MVGENPAAAEGQGIPWRRSRIGAVVAGSALMGVAGAFLTLSAFNAFFFNMVNGRGWICVALVVFASWRPGKALLGAMLFAFFDALQLRLQQSAGRWLPYQVYLMLPYACHRRAGAGGAARGLSAGVDEAVSEGRAVGRNRLVRLGPEPRRVPPPIPSAGLVRIKRAASTPMARRL